MFAGDEGRNDAETTGAPVDDATLVLAAQSDPRDFGLLYDRYVDPVYRYCYRRLGTVAAAEDATSATFFKALAAIPGFDSAAGSFRSWLFTIAHNVVSDQIRARQRRPERAIDDTIELVDRSPTPEELVVTGDERRRLRVAIAALPADQQRIVELRLAGLNGPEIASALGRSPGAIRTAQHRALARLRSLLEPEHDTTPTVNGKETRHDR